MTLKREWFSAAEVANMNLPDVPTTKANVIAMADRLLWRRPDQINRWWRIREGRGGGYEYHYSVLPLSAQATWLHLYNDIQAGEEHAAAIAAGSRNAARWAWFMERPKTVKEEAERRGKALDSVRRMVLDGRLKTDAVLKICDDYKIQQSTYYIWANLVGAVPRYDWLAFLAPKHKGRQKLANFSDEAWEYFKARYLTLARPTAELCYRDLKRDAKHHGWTIPSLRTLQRRIEKLDPRVVTRMRYGEEALDKLYPAQERDRSVFQAMEAVNADGHKFDVFVRWPDGKIGRPILVGFQDLFSGMIVSWRMGRAETSELVRLAYGDMAENIRIPNVAYFDNGRAFAAKENTGGTPNRFRGKIKPEDPEGVLMACGTRVIWITPYRGQAKPIERAWRDLSENIAKDIRCAGAWTGNNPLAKPEDYASKAVPIAEFFKIVHEGIIEHNERPARDTDACQGKLSFRQAFDQSLAHSTLPKLPETHRSIWWLATEGIKAHATDGSLRFYGNRFWAEFMVPHAGRNLTIRFDPDNIQAGLHVFDTETRFLGIAACVEKVGFNDVPGAKAHARAKSAFKRAGKVLIEHEMSLSLSDLAALRAPVEEPAPPIDTKVLRLVTRGNAALQPEQLEEDEEQPEGQRRMLSALAQVSAARRGGGLRLVEEEDAEEDVDA
jgi:putative transposase